MSTPKSEGVEVLEVAIELQAEDEAVAEARRDRAVIDETALELGVAPEQLARAEAEVERRRRLRVYARARRGRIQRWLAGVVGALAIGAGVYVATRPAPPIPWTVQVADAKTWVLDLSPGTIATSGQTLDQVRGREQAVTFVHVDHAAPDAAGKWFVNLDGRNLPAIAGHKHLTVLLSGTLPKARVYLEAGTDERWRSPPIAIQSEWTEHRLALADFEHQRKVGGEWKGVEAADPGDYEFPMTVSLKLGHFINEAQATGLVRIAEIRVE